MSRRVPRGGGPLTQTHLSARLLYPISSGTEGRELSCREISVCVICHPRRIMSWYSCSSQRQKINTCQMTGRNFFITSTVPTGCTSTRLSAEAPQTPGLDEDNGSRGDTLPLWGNLKGSVLCLRVRRVPMGDAARTISKSFFTDSFSFPYRK